MSDEPGLALLTYRRLKAAAGVTDLPALERRVDELEGEIAESRGLEEPLVTALGRVEAALVPLLEARVGQPRRDLGHGLPR